MNIVVTGGAGFIGSHLVRALIKLGHTVLVVDDLSTGRIGNLPLGVDLLEESIVSYPYLKSAFRSVDLVFHLAAIASVPKSVDNPLETMKVNVQGTANVLEAARVNGVKKAIMASSCAVYGDSTGIQVETDLPRPLSPYAWSKLIGEQLCRMYNDLYSLPTVCLRYFNVFGERQSLDLQYGLVIPKFIELANHNAPLPIYGDGKQTRDFVFVDDVIDATMLSSKDGMVGVYNVGSGVSTSVMDLALIIIRILNSKSCLDFQRARAGDPLHARAGILKIMEQEFTSKWNLEAGLRRLITPCMQVPIRT